MICNTGSCFAVLWKVGLVNKKTHKNKKKERMRSDSNMIMMPSELMIKKIKPLLFCSYCSLCSLGPSCLSLALFSFHLPVRSTTSFWWHHRQLARWCCTKPSGRTTFHVAGGDSFWHDKNTSQGQILRRWSIRFWRRLSLSVFDNIIFKSTALQYSASHFKLVTNCYTLQKEKVTILRQSSKKVANYMTLL